MSNIELLKTRDGVQSLTVLKTHSGFKTEADLVVGFVRCIESGTTYWRGSQVTREWVHPSGSTDVLIRTKSRKLIAFEAKLSDWRRAFHQAYRNASFAHHVYVLLPCERVTRPLLYRNEFELRGIGLCSLDEGRVRVHIAAAPQVRLVRWVREGAHRFFDEQLRIS